jgi:hypothetical protein
MAAQAYRLGDAATKVSNKRICAAVRTARLKLKDARMLCSANVQRLVHFSVVHLPLYCNQVFVFSKAANNSAKGTA